MRKFQPTLHRFRCGLIHTLCVAVLLAPIAMVGGRAHAQSADSKTKDDLVIADFEGDSYGEWKITGEAFGSAPARGTLPGQMVVDGFRGKGLVNSFLKGDGTVGTLTSPAFRIERNYIGFLIGGGKDPEKLVFRLLIDGKAVRAATGPNSAAGGSETLEQESWDVSEFLGQMATLQIVDDAIGGWGHINVDEIVLTDRKPKGSIRNAERELRATSRYLYLPIQNGAPQRVVTLLVNGKEIVRNQIELAIGKPDWWSVMDISSFNGRSITLRVDKLPGESTVLADLQQGNQLKDADALYREPLRGQFHFSPKRGWNNDPNGMVFFQGEYHLFFQHNPYGWGWGNMHWGHAVSKDLVTWDELGDKLLPDELGPMFSGSAVVDWKNTSGLGAPGKPPLVLIYTAAGNPTVQCIASSTDGRRFTKYDKNPVLPQVTPGNRDPKVFWHEPTQRWVMVLYVEKPAGRHTVHFFTSQNLKEWSFASAVDGDPVGKPYLFECPDFFELPVDGDVHQKKWVLLGANSDYAIGSFDGTRFTPEKPHIKGHQGRGFYAPQTFSDIPAKDGRRIQIGWFQTETKGMPFNQSMTIPLELQLKRFADGPRLTFTPVRELQALRGKSLKYDGLTVLPGEPNPLAEFTGELQELRLDLVETDADAAVINVRGVEITYDLRKQELVVEGRRTAAPFLERVQQLVIYCDRTGLEIFASGGSVYVPLPVTMKADNRTVSLSAKGGGITFAPLEVYELRSAWRR